MEYALFLGCIAPMRYPGIESATRLVFSRLGVSLVDLKGASCCPAPGVTRSFTQEAWLTLGARNLCLAQNLGLDILTICNGCFGSLFEISNILNHDEKKRNYVNEELYKIGMKYDGKVKVRHFAEVLYGLGKEKIENCLVKRISKRAGVHYGCHFLKPTKVKKLDDAENPRILDELVSWVGCTSIEYKDKMACCGAGGGVRARTPEVALKMAKSKLDNLRNANAEIIVDVCPFCHLHYDQSQKTLGYSIPVVHLTQLYGFAFGFEPARLGFELQAIPIKL
ncbi:MAG: CoB--CoM heterodisulfide reductase subunit B [Thermoplasmata archaeon]